MLVQLGSIYLNPSLLTGVSALQKSAQRKLVQSING